MYDTKRRAIAKEENFEYSSFECGIRMRLHCQFKQIHALTYDVFKKLGIYIKVRVKVRVIVRARFRVRVRIRVTFRDWIRVRVRVRVRDWIRVWGS